MTTMLTLTTAALLGALALSLERTTAIRQDTSNGPLLSGQATVSQILSGRQLASPWGYYTVELNFQGQSFWTHTAIPVGVGQRVTLHYRNGRSGLLYPVNAST
jgi:hypothetical protein